MNLIGTTSRKRKERRRMLNSLKIYKIMKEGLKMKKFSMTMMKMVEIRRKRMSYSLKCVRPELVSVLPVKRNSRLKVVYNQKTTMMMMTRRALERMTKMRTMMMMLMEDPLMMMKMTAATTTSESKTKTCDIKISS